MWLGQIIAYFADCTVSSTAKYAIMTFSLGVLQKEILSFTPPLPQWKREAIFGVSCLRDVGAVTDHPQGTQGTGLGPRAFGGPQLQKCV